MTRMIPLTNEQYSTNMITAPDSNGFPASNRQGLRSLGSIILVVFNGFSLVSYLTYYTLVLANKRVTNNKLPVYAGLILLAVSLLSTPNCWASNTNLSKHGLTKDLWKITAYCACVKCCGKSDAITASGKKARPNHTVALNWLPFGTRVVIAGREYVVEDRGAESHFGTYYHRKGAKKQVKHIDIYFASHSEARKFGVKWLPVVVR
jgi:3D (Asp-Asp-Asp) domain-containing protein